LINQKIIRTWLAMMKGTGRLRRASRRERFVAPYTPRRRYDRPTTSSPIRFSLLPVNGFDHACHRLSNELGSLLIEMSKNQ
jgi:hypothetical protein